MPLNTQQAPERVRYTAFISYSHATAGRLAPALQSALHRFAKPWYRLRAIRVFRDKTSLSVEASLWQAIERSLADSKYFVLLASPESAVSEWVRKEIDFWLEHRPMERLIIVLTGGEVAWEPTKNRFSPILRASSKTFPGLIHCRPCRPRHKNLIEPLETKSRPIFQLKITVLATRMSRKKNAVLCSSKTLHSLPITRKRCL